jgi:putative transposase
MPRKSRVVLPNYPHHIIQRGHKREVVFGGDHYYRSSLENLRALKEALGCKIYPYSLMTNYSHLIVDPGKQGETRALVMKRIFGRQTSYVNK